jgi:hypothetical protein
MLNFLPADRVFIGKTQEGHTPPRRKGEHSPGEDCPMSEHLLPLINAGYPVAAIATRADATPAEEYAAEELRRHLYAIAGAGPRLRPDALRSGGTRIALNDRDAAAAVGITPELGPEAYHLESRGDTLYCLGGGPRGVLYGVYALLQRLGCRWYTPELTRLPRRRHLALAPLREQAAPAFEYRDMWIWDGSDPAWWVRNRLNGFYTPAPDYMGGHVAYNLFVHSFYTLLPPDEFFAGHPEYYSLIDGVRRAEMGQLCLTHPDVLRIVTERVLARMRANPRATIFSVSQNDWEGPCACPDCRRVVEEEGSQAGPLLRFVNAVAARTSQEFPDKLIDTLAYWYTLDAPAHVVPHPNVRVRLCPINCCQGHPFGTCDHPESARFLRAFDAWGKITDQMYIWHYCTNFAHYPAPMPNFDELPANIRRYRDTGVCGVFMQGMGEDGGGGEMMPLRGWLIAQLLRNPDEDAWARVDEFLGAYYGAGAGAVRRYLDLFHARVRADRSLHPSLYDLPTGPLFDGDIIPAADAALAEGEAATRGAERRRIALLRAGLGYTRLWRLGGTFRLEDDRFASSTAPADRAALAGVLETFTQAGMRRIREGAPIAVTANLLRNRFDDHPVLWLRDGDDAAAVVPNLGGRLLELHLGGRQWLAPPDPANAYIPYPMSEGYAELVSLHAYTHYGGTERYRASTRGEALRVTANLPDGLRLARTYRLRDGALHITSTLTNRGTTPRRVTWGAGLHLSAAGATTGTTADTYPWDALPDGFGAARILDGPHLPAGRWWVALDGLRLTHAWQGDMGRAILGRDTHAGILGLDLRAPAVSLAPGGKLVFRQTVSVSPDTR